MISRTVPGIKRAQKASSILRIAAPFVQRIIQEHPELQGLGITRVVLSHRGSLATLYVYLNGGEPAYVQALKTLTLYKGALRKALASEMSGRYVCELRFAYDAEFERVEHLESLIDRAVAREEE